MPPWGAVVPPIWDAAERGTSLPRGSAPAEGESTVRSGKLIPSIARCLPIARSNPSPAGGVHGKRGKDFSPCSSSSSCGLSPAQSGRCSLPPFPPTHWKTNPSRSDEIPLHPEWRTSVSLLGQIPACKDPHCHPTLSPRRSLRSRGARRYPDCVFLWQLMLEKLSLKENTCTWRFRSPPSSLPPRLSLGWPSCSLLPAKPGLLFLAPALPGGERGCLRCLRLLKRQQSGVGEDKKAAFWSLWLRNSPAVGLLRNGGDSLASLLGGRRMGSDGPHGAGPGWGPGISQPPSPGVCACRGPSARVVPTGDTWSSSGRGPGHSPSPERPLCARGFP